MCILYNNREAQREIKLTLFCGVWFLKKDWVFLVLLLFLPHLSAMYILETGEYI